MPGIERRVGDPGMIYHAKLTMTILKNLKQLFI